MLTRHPVDYDKASSCILKLISYNSNNPVNTSVLCNKRVKKKQKKLQKFLSELSRFHWDFSLQKHVGRESFDRGYRYAIEDADPSHGLCFSSFGSVRCFRLQIDCSPHQERI